MLEEALFFHNGHLVRLNIQVQVSMYRSLTYRTLHCFTCPIKELMYNCWLFVADSTLLRRSIYFISTELICCFKLQYKDVMVTDPTMSSVGWPDIRIVGQITTCIFVVYTLSLRPFLWFLNQYSKPCTVLSGHSKRRPTIVFKTDYRWMQVKSIAKCSNGSILQYFWILVLYIFEWPFYTGFTVCVII